PVVVTGRIEKPGDVHGFTVQAVKGQRWSVRVEAASLGYLLDPVLIIQKEDGTLLKEVDDAARTDRDAAIVQPIPADGTYRLLVRDLHHHGGMRYVYRMTLNEAQNDFSLSLAAQSFVLTPGKP